MTQSPLRFLRVSHNAEAGTRVQMATASGLVRHTEPLTRAQLFALIREATAILEVHHG